MMSVEHITLKVNFDLRQKSSLCDYSDGYMFDKGIVSVAAAAGASANNYSKDVGFRNCDIY